MLIKPGTRCFYLDEYISRPPVQCEVIELVARTANETEVYRIKILGAADSVVGIDFFAEVGPIKGLRDPDNIVPTRSYIGRNAWVSDTPKFGIDVIENGFLCSKAGLQSYFANCEWGEDG